jgi:hypothetical protein
MLCLQGKSICRLHLHGSSLTPILTLQGQLISYWQPLLKAALHGAGSCASYSGQLSCAHSCWIMPEPKPRRFCRLVSPVIHHVVAVRMPPPHL